MHAISWRKNAECGIQEQFDTCIYRLISEDSKWVIRLEAVNQRRTDNAVPDTLLAPVHFPELSV